METCLDALVQGPNPGWDSPLILFAGTGGLLLLLAFAMIERRSRDPLLPPRLLLGRALMLALFVAFMFMATFGSLLYFLSIYFQNVRGYDALLLVVLTFAASLERERDSPRRRDRRAEFLREDE